MRYTVKKMDPELEVKIKEATKLIAEMSQDKLRFKYSLQMVHGSKSLTKEKQLLKDMKLSQQDDKFVTFWTQLEQELEMQLRKVILKPLLITMESTEMWNCKASDYDAMVKNNVNANAAWKGIISSSSGLKKALQEKVKVASERIEELRKTLLALGLGKIISQVERESEAMKRGIDSWRKRFPYQIVYENVWRHSDVNSMRLESLSYCYYYYY
ncbi:PREDICTED: uncharacterized protein LOC101291396 [Fragaria vesca subsp. vesca]|uniref:uncharacterized protein LOC101291396 n=1 Tax=Fragaria vesca subsp. vesca TaxID=101020 RepID=UPI0002C3296E|nr:PREDICTED: uncharacterized protein LOC101291396 [Fragaria vesca subsp. vesca]XP_011458915.1 PREDICTED: uncharacterized protein LOC101291396 [Fragaria vesca subsp. vesca]